MPSQSAAWIFPDVFALILCALILTRLRQQRDEAGGLSLSVMAGTVALWAFLDLGMVLSGNLAVSMSLARSIYLPQVAMAAAWLFYAMSYSGQQHLLRRWPGLLVLGVGAVPVLLILAGDPGEWLVAGGRMSAGARGFIPEFGAWKPIHRGYSWGLGIFSSGVLALHVGQSPRHLYRLVFVLGGPLVAGLSYVLPLAVPGIPDWVNLQPLGLALATASFAWGLMRSGDEVGSPVARYLVVEEMEDAVLVLDRKGRIVDLNRAATRRLGLRLMGPVPVPLGLIWTSLKDHAREEGSTSFTEDVQLEVDGGRQVPFEVRVTVLGPPAGQDRTVLVVRDIEEQVQLERRLEAMTLASHHRAHTDELTNLPNRRAVMRRLEEEIERARRYQRPLSLVILDLDHFKHVNDNHGHTTGDQVLIATADAMDSVIRELDMAGRMGGEEFAVILPETDLAGGHTMADRMRLEIGRRTHEAPGGGSFRVTASLGVATLEPGAPATLKELIHAADEALYKAKDLGRNRVSLAS